MLERAASRHGAHAGPPERRCRYDRGEGPPRLAQNVDLPQLVARSSGRLLDIAPELVHVEPERIVIVADAEDDPALRQEHLEAVQPAPVEAAAADTAEPPVVELAPADMLSPHERSRA